MVSPNEFKAIQYTELNADGKTSKMASQGLNLSFLLAVLTFIVSFLIFIQFSNIQESIDKNTDILADLKFKGAAKSEETYISEKFMDMRKKALLESKDARANLVSKAAGNDNKAFYAAVKTEAHCPIISRVGGSGDGGKFVCNPTKSKRGCTHLSLGLNNQIDYDIAIQKITNDQQCKILGVDKSEQLPTTKQVYDKIRGTAFVGMIPTDITIGQMLEKAGSKEVDLMKIDIEGGEHTALEPFLKEYHVCQIFLEIHGSPTEHLTMMKKIARLGFRLFSVEPNIYCVTCCEYSYINELCMQQFGVIPLANNVPLD